MFYLRVLEKLGIFKTGHSIIIKSRTFYHLKMQRVISSKHYSRMFKGYEKIRFLKQKWMPVFLASIDVSVNRPYLVGCHIKLLTDH